LLTLLGFAVALLLSILGTVVYSLIEHVTPNLPFAYRRIALPFAVTVGAVVLVGSLIVEIRRYWQGGHAGAAKTGPRIAIPIPHSSDREYVGRALTQYEKAVELAGGEPVRIELEQTPEQVKKQIEGCDAVLLPGSKADVDPQKYGAARHEKTASADAKRDAIDELLLRDAYKLRKPVLCICYGLQTLNVYRSGSLVQHIESEINHAPGRTVAKAHTVEVEPGSRLAEIVGGTVARPGGAAMLAVNSSHHQSADAAGDGLRVVARCPEDGVVEALEGTDPGHFVLAVQWHPERSVNDGPEVSGSAQAIFQAFIEAARRKHAELPGEVEAASRER